MLSIMADVSLILGHHAPRQRGLGMVHVYGRDVQAAPLREMERCLREIREGHFRPDATRSGMFAGHNGSAVVTAKGPVPSEPAREEQVPRLACQADEVLAPRALSDTLEWRYEKKGQPHGIPGAPHLVGEGGHLQEASSWYLPVVNHH